MLRALISGSVRFRAAVLALSAALVAYGVRVADTAPVDVFPEFAPPLVEVQTEAPGLSTEEVEALVSVPLESALNGTPGLRTLRSKSVLGLSSVVLILDPSADVGAARQYVGERLAGAARSLPQAAHAPVMLHALSSLSRALKIGVTSTKLDQVGMTTLAKWTIRPRLMAVPGVANVAIWGQRDRELQVKVDPERLAAAGVAFDDVVRATKDATTSESGGYVDTPNQRIAVRHAPTVRTAAELAEAPLAVRGGAALRLRDVADVVEGFPPPIGDAVIDDVPGLLLIVEKQLGANTVAVTRGVEDALRALAPQLGDVRVDPTIFRPATFVERSLENLNRAVLVGCALVVLVLVLFLADWRTAVISLLAIPLSLAAALALLAARGVPLDVMVLAGLAVAVGEVVDDAIIDVENIARRLRENRARGAPLAVWRVVLNASLEVRSAVVYASVVVALVFLPVLALEGTSGAFFRPLATSYLLAVGASLVVALTVTPALASLLRPGDRDGREPPVARLLGRAYAATLPAVLRRPRLCALALVLCFGGAAYTTHGLGEEFLPNFRETDFLMHFVEKPGTSLDAMTRVTIAASRELRAIPGVRNFGSHLGRAEVADEVVGPNFTELWISLDPSCDYAATVARVDRVVQSYPGLQRDLLTYLKERIKEVLTGASASVVVRLFGDDLGALRAAGKDVAEKLAPIAGVANLKVEAQATVPQLEVRLRTDVATTHGLTSADVRRAATGYLKGRVVGEVYEDQKSFAVAVRGRDALRADPAAVGALEIATPAGGRVRLRDVADVALVAAPNEIKREGASRRLDVTLNVKGRDLGAVARDVAETLRAAPPGGGVRFELLGEYAEREAARRRLLVFAAAALLGVLIVLQSDFRSARLTTIAFLTLPFALVGGVWAVRATTGALSLGSLVGFVTVLGVAARNGILLVDRWRRLREEGVPFGPELVARGAAERLAPILMTALATALALLPIALHPERPGHEIEAPMAAVILGGLATSTLLNLYALPALYLRFGRRAADAS